MLDPNSQAVQGVTVAPFSVQIVPQSKPSDQLNIDVLAAKFQQHNPAYRQRASLREDHGIDLSNQTLSDSILAAAQLLVPVEILKASTHPAYTVSIHNLLCVPF